MKIKFKRFKQLANAKIAGFTLAEVLITMGIIGVVAALTIPALIKNTNDRETITRLKKAYSVLSSATNQIVAENGQISTWDWDTGDLTMDNIINDYKKYLNFSKSCPYNNSSCYYETKWKALNGNTYFYYYSGGQAYYNILQDGTYVKFLKFTGNAASTGCLTNDLTPKMQVIVNLNGEKPPNQVGRDVFYFYLTQEKGLTLPNLNINAYCNVTNSGTTCATKIMQEDAINY